MFHNFVKVAAAIPVVEAANCKTNAERIFELIQDAENQCVEVVCFPELSITGYTCGDLFHNSTLLENAKNALKFLLEKTENFKIISIVGMPIMVDNQLFNCAVVFRGKEILGIVPKTHLSNDENRWFASALDLQRLIPEEEYLKNEICFCEQVALFAKNIVFYAETENLPKNEDNEFAFSVEINEDLAVVPPSSLQALAGAHIIFNPSAFNELVGKNDYRKKLVEQQSGRCNAGYVYVSAGFGESSTDLLFASSAIIAENGTILAESERFTLDKQLIISEIDIERLRNERLKNNSFKRHCGLNSPPLEGLVVAKSLNFFEKRFIGGNDTEMTLTRKISKHPFIPTENLNERCSEVFNILTNALAVRLFNTKIERAVIGISGGLDSTLALLVTVAAFDKLKIDRKNIVGITMPCFGTTSRTKNNALNLMYSLGITSKEISIEKAVLQHFSDIEQDIDNQDITFENSQARERMQVLMDYANKIGGLVIGTGNMSELALGWTTYNGDHISMYGVNSGVPKTLVRHLVKWYATCHCGLDPQSLENSNDVKKQTIAGMSLRATTRNRNDSVEKTLLDICATPISPELLPANEKGEIVQKTEDIIGNYELHDFFLYYFLRFGFSPEKILFLAENAFCYENKEQRTKNKDEKIYTKEEIKKWLKVFIQRFFTQQFKRSCMPDGVKVGSVNLSPRGSLRMPSDANAKEWLEF